MQKSKEKQKNWEDLVDGSDATSNKALDHLFKPTTAGKDSIHMVETTYFELSFKLSVCLFECGQSTHVMNDPRPFPFYATLLLLCSYVNEE